MHFGRCASDETQPLTDWRLAGAEKSVPGEGEGVRFLYQGLYLKLFKEGEGQR